AVTLPLAHDLLTTHERSRLRPTLRHAHDHVGGEQLAEGIHVACVPRIAHRLYDLDVLLRHRVASIPQRRVTPPARPRAGSRCRTSSGGAPSPSRASGVRAGERHTRRSRTSGPSRT